MSVINEELPVVTVDIGEAERLAKGLLPTPLQVVGGVIEHAGKGALNGLGDVVSGVKNAKAKTALGAVGVLAPFGANVLHAVPAAADTASDQTTYAFVDGDNPTKVAKQEGIPLDSIMYEVLADGRTDKTVPVGFKVHKPGATADQTTYAFVDGDNPTKVAKQEGIPLERIMYEVLAAGHQDRTIPVGFEVHKVVDMVAAAPSSAPIAAAVTPESQAAPPITEQAQPVWPSEAVNIDAIGQVGGAEADTTKAVMRYLMDIKRLPAQNAAAYVAVTIGESDLRTDVVGDHGSARGINQMRADRQDGMPDDLYGQIDFALDVDMVRGGYQDLIDMLHDPNTDMGELVRNLVHDWERPRDKAGETEKRGGYAMEIMAALQTPKPEPAPAPVAVAPTPEPAASSLPEAPASAAQEVPQGPDLSNALIDQTSLRQESNGIQTVEVGGIRVNVDIAPNLANMMVAAANDGIELSANSSFRDSDEQRALRQQNDCPDIDSAPANSCRVPTAIPGTSKHEKGLAIDFKDSSSHGDATYQWLSSNAENFGFQNLPSEPWHWSVDGH